MRVVALISGGKDSCYNIMQCISAGHSVIALANLKPQFKDEIDSYMYQTVGHQCIELYAEATGLPLYRDVISGEALEQGKNYQETPNDEVEDLFNLLSRIKDDLFIEAVAVGAILSDYQRIRVENVCHRLGLVCLAYLWRRNQKELLQEMITNGVEAIIIKVAALGLDPRLHLGLTLREIQPHLLMMQEKYGLNVCGEGGEYETFTLDCPLFKKKLVIDNKELVILSCDPVAPVGYLNLSMHLEDKNSYEIPKLLPNARNSLEFINELSDSVFSDLSDIELSETELESIEKLEKEEKKKQSELSVLLDVGDAKTSTRLETSDLPDDSVESINEELSHDKVFADAVRLPIQDHSSIFGNKHGWYFIGGIVGEGEDTSTATTDAINKLIILISSKEMSLRAVCSVNIYMRNMADYEQLNKIYVDTFSFANPPTRVCVQCPLPSNVGLILDAVAHKSKKSEGHSNGVHKERVTMHVQGISHWAPANIGPYSQAVKIGEIFSTCGQIALMPATMQLIGGGARRECALALRHLTRVIRAVNTRAHIRSVVQSVCYVRQGGAISEARRQLERRTAGALVQYAVVEALPRGANVEWHAWGHVDNTRFEYEETGCNIGGYKVAMTRRWNYENSVAAIVCYVATGSSPSSCRLAFPSHEACHEHRMMASQISLTELVDLLQYATKKLLNECYDREPNPALNIRIFYQVWSAPPPNLIIEAMEICRTRVCPLISFTVVPVTALHNAFTFLSISGLRLDE